MSDGWGEENGEIGRRLIESRDNAVPSDPKRGASPDFEVVDLDILEGLPPRHNKEGGRSEDLSAEGSPPLGAQEPRRDEDGMSLQEISRARWMRAVGTGSQSGTSSGTAGRKVAGQAPRRNEAEAEHEGASFRVFDLSDPPPAEDPWASPPRSRKRAASHGMSVAKSHRAGDSTMLVNIDDDDDDDDIVMIASSSSSRCDRAASDAAAAAASSSSSSAHSGGRKRRPGVGGSKNERLDPNQISTIVVDIVDSPDASTSSSGGEHVSSSSSSSFGKRRRRQKASQPDDCIVVMEKRPEEEEKASYGGVASADNQDGASGAGAGAGGDDNGIEERAKRARMQVASTVSSKRGFTCPVCMEDEWEKGTQVRQGPRRRLPSVLLPHPFVVCEWIPRCSSVSHRFALSTLPG